MVGRRGARAKAAEPRPTGNERLGRIIQDALDRRNGIGDVDVFELPIVVACRDLIANTIGQLPLVNYRSGLPTADQPPIVVRPDPTETRRDTMARLSYQLTGPGYAWVIPTSWYADNTTPSSVRVVDAAEAAGIYDQRGQLTDVVWEGEHYDPTVGEVHLVRWRVDHVGAPGDAGPLGGCRKVVTYLAALWQMAGSFWEAGFPSIALMLEQALTTTQRRETKQAMVDAFARSHEPAVIDRGGRLEPLGSNAVESQLVESIGMANAEVARVFGVFPSLVNVDAAGSLTYSTTEGELRKWLALGLGAFITPIEATWSDLRPYGQVVQFDTGRLLRTDLAGRYNGYSIAPRPLAHRRGGARRRRSAVAATVTARLHPRPARGGLDPTRVPVRRSRHDQLGANAMTRHQLVARAAATLTAPTWHTVARRADVADVEGDLTLRARLVPWDQPSRVSDDGRRFYTETWQAGSLVPDSRVVLYDGHVPGDAGLGAAAGRRTPIGRVDGFTDEADGLYGVMHLAASARGRDVYELARTLGTVDVSIEPVLTEAATPGDTVVRSSAAPLALAGVAIILPPYQGAFPGAVATAARADADNPDADDEDEDADPDAPADPNAPPAPPASADTARSVAEVVRTELARYRMPGRRGGVAAHALARFTAFDELHHTARSSRSSEAATLSAAFTEAYHQHRRLEAANRSVVGRAWVDQITTDNPGLIPPAWITEVFGIIDSGRAGITALGGPRSPGDSGMEVNWPYYDGDLTLIVKQQLTEKTEINSVKVSFKRASEDLRTYAGGSDVSYQLQRRSSPSYMALYDRILQMAYGVTTETAFDTDIVAAAGGPHLSLDLAADDDGSATRAFLFQASFSVMNATGTPATAVLAAPDVFAALGGKAWLQAPQYGTQNIPGTTSAATLRINISGLEIVEAIGMAPGTMVVTNQQAAQWLEAGPYLATAEDIAKLGTDVAIWGMGCTGAFLPSGIVVVDVNLTTLPLTSSRSSSAK